MLKKYVVTMGLIDSPADAMNKFVKEYKIDEKNIISIREKELRSTDVIEVWVREEALSEEENNRYWNLYARTSSAGPG